METISTNFPESSTSGLEVTLTDVNGNAVDDSAITSCSYSIATIPGKPVNNRTDTPLPTSATVIIELTPDDTTMTKVEQERGTVDRYVIVKWVYEDPKLGADSERTKGYKITLERQKI